MLFLYIKLYYFTDVSVMQFLTAYLSLLNAPVTHRQKLFLNDTRHK